MMRYLIGFISLFPIAAFGAAAELLRADPDFRPRFERLGGVVYTIHVEADGTIFAAGTFSGAGPASGDNIVKILPDGAPDPAFHPVTTDEGRVLALATQADGKLLVGGEFEVVAGSNRKVFMRLNTDGSVDESFGSETTASSRVTSIVVQPDGRILVGGEFSQYAGQNRPALVRLLEDGTLDPDFTTDLANTNPFYTSIALQNDGRILFSGNLQFNGGTARTLVRLNADGSEDTTFQVPAYPGQNGSVRTILLQPDGKILLGGSFWNEMQTIHKGLYRLNSDGSVDSTFLPGADIDDPEVVALARFSDGRIAAAGIFHTVMGEVRDRIVVLHADGTLDPSFVPDDGNENPKAMKLLPNGKLLWGGPGFLARLNGDGTVDDGFLHSVRRPANVSAILQLDDGKWLVGGGFTYANAQPRGSIARLLADGTLDPSFVAGTGFVGTVSGLARGSDGDVYVQGNFSSYQGEAVRDCIRLNADGSRDAEFSVSLTASELLLNPTVDASGRLWMGLQDSGGAFTGMKVVRFLANGQIDPAFASPTIFNGYFTHLLPQANGSVIVTGNFGPFTGMSIPGGVARLLADGTRDTTFPAGTGFDALVNSAIQLTDGSLILAGEFNSFDGSPAHGLARLTSAGTLDPTFAPPSFTTRLNYDLAVQADDRFWALGWYSLDGQNYNSLLRFTPVGTVDLAPQVNQEDRYPSLFELALVADNQPAVAGDWDNDAFPAAGGFVLLEPAPVPVITTPPAPQTAEVGAAVTFTVAASGDPATYQWYRNGNPIPGATSATLALTNVELEDAGAYTVVLKNSWGTATSVPATLSGPNPVPTVVMAPGSIVAVAGQPAALNVQASGTGTLSYQWRKFGMPIAGATGSSLSFDSTAFADAGFYDVLVGDGMSVARTASVAVRVKPPFYPNLLRPRASFAPQFEADGGAIRVILPLSDGRFYAAGIFARASGEDRTNVVRLEADGSLDSSFVPPILLGGTVQALARQADGKLLVAGDLRVHGASEQTGLVRLNDDGSLDTGFQLGGELDGVIDAIAVQADGGILIGGTFTTVGGEPRGRIARLDATGALDPTFTTGTGFNSRIMAIRVQSDGGILAMGGFGSYNDVQLSSYGLARLESDGTYDTSFVFQPVPFAAPTAFALLPDDRLIVGMGYGTPGTPLLVRTDPDGDIELNFALTSPGGVVSLDAVAPQSDGKVQVSVSTLPANSTGFYSEVMRFNADGTRDEDFGGGVTNSAEQVIALAVTSDGGSLVGGTITQLAGVAVGGLARLDGTGAVVETFDPDLSRQGVVQSIAPASAGGWWVGGGFSRVNGVETGGLVRIRPDGTLDSAFAPDHGMRLAVFDLVEQGDGKVVAAGMFGGEGVVPDWGLARFASDGQRDESYHPAPFAGAFSTDVALLPDGSVLASGTPSGISGTPRIFARILADGTIDPDYGTALTFSNAPQVIETLVDGRAYVGEATLSTPEHFQVGLARLMPDGSVDESFVASGLPASNVSAVASRPDGSLWVGGSFPNGFQPLEYRNLVRLLSSGARDSNFALTEPFSSGVSTMVAQDDGNVLVAGPLTFRSDIAFSDTLARFLPDGSRAPGPVVTGFGLRDPIPAMAEMADGGLLVAGNLEFENFLSGGLAVLEPVPEPMITREPVSPAPTQAGGDGVTLSVDALTNGDTSYQWQVQYPGGAVGEAHPLGATPSAGDGFVDVAGANGPTLSFPVPQRFHNGVYRVVITANGNSVTSKPVTVEIDAATPSADARLLNLSTRALVQTGDQVLIPGFVIVGSGSKRVLIRAVGPTLGEAPFNVPGVLADPRILVKKHNFTTGLDDDVEANDNWGTNANFAELKQTMTDLYAFAIPDNSADAALLLDLTPGQYTVVTDGVASGTGIAIVELYDADASGTTARLVNISNRGFVGTGANVMIPGFVVSSEGPKTLLIRAVGPTLAGAPFNVGGTMADPKLTVYQTNQAMGTSTEILAQDNWSENPDAAYTAQIAQDVSAFALNAGSADAAFVVTLPPGVYTVIGSAADGTSTGVVLVEVYVVE